MNTNTRATQVKHLTLCLTALLGDLTVLNFPPMLVNHNDFTCEALCSGPVTLRILKSTKFRPLIIDFLKEARRPWRTKRFRDAVSFRSR